MKLRTIKDSAITKEGIDEVSIACVPFKGAMVFVIQKSLYDESFIQSYR